MQKKDSLVGHRTVSSKVACGFLGKTLVPSTLPGPGQGEG